MNKYFEVFGLDDNATIEQVNAAYERKLAYYQSAAFADDPAYAKRKMDELQTAYLEVCRQIEGDSPEDEKTSMEDTDTYMQALYHKHLTKRINKLAGVHPKRGKQYREVDRKYKGSVLIFWGAVLAVLLLIGVML